MKNINKIIHHKIFEIFLAVTVIFVSFPIWKSLNINDHIATAAFYNEAQYTFMEVLDNQVNNLFPIEDELALKNLKRTNITVKNETRTKEEYTLLLKISKDSTIDISVLKVSVHNNIYSLKDILLLEDEEFYYFTLATDSLSGDAKQYNFLMWMNSETGNEMQGKTISYSFDLQKGIKI